MKEYKRAEVAATEWQRCNKITIFNPLGATPVIDFQEERVIVAGNDTVKIGAGRVEGNFSPTAAFPLINPDTGEPTGGTMSHSDLYVVLHSLYMHMAQMRDVAVEEGRARAAAEAAAAAAAAAEKAKGGPPP